MLSGGRGHGESGSVVTVEVGHDGESSASSSDGCRLWKHTGSGQGERGNRFGVPGGVSRASAVPSRPYHDGADAEDALLAVRAARRIPSCKPMKEVAP